MELKTGLRDEVVMPSKIRGVRPNATIEEREAELTRAFVMGNLKVGRAAADALLDDELATSDLQNRVFRAVLPFALELATLTPDSYVIPIVVPVKEGWSRFNPSIVASDGGSLCTIRSANYSLEFRPRVSYRFRGPSLSEHLLVNFDQDLRRHSARPIVDVSPDCERLQGFHRGFEDFRLFHDDERLLASATARDRSPNNVNQQWLLELIDARIISVSALSHTENGRPEKNWMPIEAGGAILFVSRCSPLQVVMLDEPTGEPFVALDQPAPAIGRTFRGGSQLIRIPGGFLCVVHEVILNGPRREAYLHRFVQYDERLAMVGVSPHFRFLGEPVEFCAGMVLDRERLILSFGINDADAFLITVPAAAVFALISPVASMPSAGLPVTSCVPDNRITLG